MSSGVLLMTARSKPTLRLIILGPESSLRSAIIEALRQQVRLSHPREGPVRGFCCFETESRTYEYRGFGYAPTALLLLEPHTDGALLALEAGEDLPRDAQEQL